jgi:hypothetical protein
MKVKQFKLTGVALIAGLVLSGCSSDSGGSKSSAESDGACSEATVAAYNDLLGKARSFSISSSRSDLEELNRSCSRFSASIGGGACKAKNLSTGETASVSYNDVKSMCDQAAAALNSSSGNNQPAEISPNPSVDDRRIADLPRGFSIRVVSTTAINELLRGGQDRFIQGGRILYSTSSLESGKPVCLLLADSAKTSVQYGEILNMTRVEVEGDKLVVGSENGDVMMVCVKPTSSSAWTLNKLQSVFSGVADISAAD